MFLILALRLNLYSPRPVVEPRLKLVNQLLHWRLGFRALEVFHLESHLVTRIENFGQLQFALACTCAHGPLLQGLEPRTARHRRTPIISRALVSPEPASAPSTRRRFRRC